MRISHIKKTLYLFYALLSGVCCLAQATIPWSSSVNVTFGQGRSNPGPPLSQGHSDFIYTTEPCPSPGYYTVLNKVSCPGQGEFLYDAGRIFISAIPLSTDSGYMMLVNTAISSTPSVIFTDTVKNLCGNSPYLFWAAIENLSNVSCLYPNCAFTVETITGQVIETFQTGDIGGPSGKLISYPGYWGPIKPPSYHYYGGSFDLPAGVSDIVLKITQNSSTGPPGCSTSFIIDNIFLSAVGPDIRVVSRGNPDAWVTGTCFQGNNPIALTAGIGSGYVKFGGPAFVNAAFADPAYQWQQSVGDSYTWTDIPGETSLNISHSFSIPDTFFIRLRVSESNNIGNQNCSVVSNVIKVQVDGIPSDFKVSSNTPVCTDADILFTLEGGASYTTHGPNNFFDDSPLPHIYHPALSDSGWYYTEIISFGGCKATDSTYVKVIGPDITIGPGQEICSGKTVQLTSGGGTIYAWSPADGLSDINIADPLATPSATTTYKVKVTDQSGCSAEDTVTIKILNSVLRAAFTGPAIVCPKDIALFVDSSAGNIVNWNWDFGNGQTSQVRNPPAQSFLENGNVVNYSVKLVVTDTAGCTATTTHMVRSVKNCFISVPSAFTPNNDGLNDYLYPLNAYDATNLLFRVYNRLGQLVFETKDWTKKWDGNINGNPQSGGAFVWTLNYTGTDNKKVSLSGTTVLIR